MGTSLKVAVGGTIRNRLGYMLRRNKRGLAIIIARSDLEAGSLRLHNQMQAMGYQSKLLVEEARFFEKALHINFLGWDRKGDCLENNFYYRPFELTGWAESKLLAFLSSYVFDRDIDRDDVDDILTVAVLRRSNAFAVKQRIRAFVDNALDERSYSTIAELTHGFGPDGANQMLLELEAYLVQ
ncbi:MAG: hypothetical protein IT292_08885 [Deltaproteobacteria bacterium]|nr:hypothetical protein [Deltaproteobacteria bacterium]